MPFVVKDALQYKRNDRQIREIHERQYANYVTNLRQQQQRHCQPSNKFYLSSNHIQEVERSRLRYALDKRIQFDRIHRENYDFYNRLTKASQRSLIDNKNDVHQQNLKTSNVKRSEQRFKEYTRIYNDNQSLLKRIITVPGRIATRDECDNDWERHINIMKTSCNYPENIDQFVGKTTKNQPKQTCPYSRMKHAQENRRHSVTEPASRLTITPLALLLKES